MTENNIQFVEVFIQEKKKKIQTFLNKNNHQQPDVVIMDQGAIARGLNVYLIPRLVLIDKDFIVYRDGDPLSSDVLKRELLEMMLEK